MIRLLIVDDHVALRQGLQDLFATVAGIEVVGVAADGRQAVTQTHRLAPDVVLMDIEMPNVDGVEATRRITTTHPTSRVVILTASHNQSRIQDALRAGAISYVLKDSDPHQVVRAVQDARRGASLTEARRGAAAEGRGTAFAVAGRASAAGAETTVDQPNEANKAAPSGGPGPDRRCPS